MDVNLDRCVDDAWQTEPDADLSEPQALNGGYACANFRPAADVRAQPLHACRLVLAVVLGGLILDDPWRHAYLRHRWTGVDGRGRNGRGD